VAVAADSAEATWAAAAADMEAEAVDIDRQCAMFVRPKSGLLGKILAAGFLAVIHAFPQTPKPLQAPDKPDVLNQLSGTLEAISQRSGQAVVQIYAKSYVTSDSSSVSDPLLTAQESTGSGVILSADGFILTNDHVVRGATQVRVKLAIRRRDETREHRSILRGIVVGADHETDLALIKVEQTDLPFLSFGNSDELQQGQIVLALGSPMGLDHSVSFGIISSVARQVKPDNPMVYIQTDAPINPGNSGGPLVDSRGRVVGINTMILSQSGGSEGIGFSIPSNVAEQVYLQLKKSGHVHRSKLGLIGETITFQLADGLNLSTDRGVIVSDLEPSGPADSAGVKRDDIVVAVDNKTVYSIRQFEAYIYRLPRGTRVTLRIRRGEKFLDIPVDTVAESDEIGALADRLDPVKDQIPQLGILGVDITEDLLKLLPDLDRPQGVLVAIRNSSVGYAGAQLQVGDAIYEMNRQIVSSVEGLRKLLEGIQSGEAVVLLIQRDGHLVYVPLELE
jgi:serine protease Do